MKFSKNTYDFLKWVAQFLGTITAVDAFLGVLLGISSNAYYKDLKKI